MYAFRRIGFLAALAIVIAPRDVHAALSGIQRVGTNATMNYPAFATHAPGDPNRLFVAELGGAIKIIDLNTNNVLATPFLSIPDVDAEGEGGLLGVAFHPNYYAPVGTTGRGLFYVYVTVDNTLPEMTSPFSSHIREYSVVGDPATSNLASATPTREILQFTQPQSNHNAGWIGFNPQVTPGQAQYLYIMSGDGGGGGDTGAGHTPGFGNGQDVTSNFLGKTLRIDVNSDAFTGANDPTNTKNYAIPSGNPFNGTDGDQEIWAYGLRNPYRASFDRATGDLWIGDVGQDNREEIDFQAASKTTVSNYGWRLWEGNQPYGASAGDPFPTNYVGPIYDYTRGSGDLQGETVIGGYRYRGPDPDLQGRYFFGDANDLNTWQMIPPNPVVANTAVTNIDALLGNLTGINRIVSFGEDSKGNLYIVDLATSGAPNTGEVYRILTNKLLPGDYTADGEVDMLDYDLWRSTFGTSTGSRPADGSGNGIVDAADYVVWRENMGATVHTAAGAELSQGVPELASAIYLGQSMMLFVFGSIFVRRRK